MVLEYIDMDVVSQLLGYGSIGILFGALTVSVIELIWFAIIKALSWFRI